MNKTEAHKRAALKTLYDAYQADPAPSLAGIRQGHNFVPGVGSVSPYAVFVGEAPGGTENRLRRPFCGPSGRVLDELLASVGWTRDQVWITNCVKYRPDDDNRDPTPQERNDSRPYLMRELAIIGCRYIVTLGKQPLQVFVKDANYEQLRGSWHYVSAGISQVWNLLPLYHPAVGVYQRSRKPQLIREFQAVKAVPHATV